MSEGRNGAGAVRSPRMTRKRAKAERAIVAAAEAEFRDRGYEGARLEAIADRADVSVGSIYNHFENKRALYSAVALRAVELFGRYMDAGYREARTALECVLAGGDSYMRFNVDHPAAFRFIALNGIEARGAELDSELDQEISRKITGILAKFQDKIAEAIEEGDAFDLDPRHVGAFLFGSWNGVVALTMREDEQRVSDEEVTEMLRMGRRMVIEGLASGKVRGEDGHFLPEVRLVEIDSPPETLPD